MEAQIERILNRRNLDNKGKEDLLLEMDASLRTNLGCDSTKAEVKEAKQKSRKIYRAIRDNIDPFWGTYFLRTLDLD